MVLLKKSTTVLGRRIVHPEMLELVDETPDFYTQLLKFKKHVGSRLKISTHERIQFRDLNLPGKVRRLKIYKKTPQLGRLNPKDSDSLKKIVLLKHYS